MNITLIWSRLALTLGVPYRASDGFFLKIHMIFFRLHFEKLAKFSGYRDSLAFAEKVVYSLPEERVAWLKDFYLSEDKQLAPIFVEEEEKEVKIRTRRVAKRKTPAVRGEN